MSERILVVDPGERVGWCHANITPDRLEVQREQVEVEPGAKKIWSAVPADSPTGVYAAVPGSAAIEVTGHGIAPWKDFMLKFHEVCGNYDTVVLERYRIFAQFAKTHIGSDVPTLQCVGQVKLCAWLNPRVKLVMQGPTNMKTGIKVAPPAIAEILARLPKSHDEAHDGSALAHLSYYWFKNYAS